MKNIGRYTPVLSMLLIILLVLYAVDTNPSILRKDTSIAKLEKNRDYYEGKEIILGIFPLEEIKEKSMIVSDWNKDAKVEVSITAAPDIDGELRDGAIVTVTGISYLRSRGYIEAREIHIHKNYFWRMYLSPIGLILLLILLHKDRIIRRVHA